MNTLVIKMLGLGELTPVAHATAVFGHIRTRELLAKDGNLCRWRQVGEASQNCSELKDIKDMSRLKAKRWTPSSRRDSRLQE